MFFINGSYGVRDMILLSDSLMYRSDFRVGEREVTTLFHYTSNYFKEYSMLNTLVEHFLYFFYTADISSDRN